MGYFKTGLKHGQSSGFYGNRWARANFLSRLKFLNNGLNMIFMDDGINQAPGA